MTGRTGARWRRAAGALLATAAVTATGLLAVESPAAAAKPSFECYQTYNLVSCDVDPGFVIGFFYSEWYVNGHRDWEFDDESYWWDSCLQGDFYHVRVEVSGSAVFTAEDTFNCFGNG